VSNDMGWRAAGRRMILKMRRKPASAANDDLSLTLSHREIIRKKAFLRGVYEKFYNEIKREICCGGEGGRLVELGSGGGFVKEVIPGVITSDILRLPFVDVVFSASEMPFKDGAVDGFMMLNAFHHLNDVAAFLRETSRCLKKGGRLVMIEPSNTPLARFIWKYLHGEPYDPAGGWKLPRGGPLSIANSAMPYIVFNRDSKRLEEEFPSLRLMSVKTHTPFMYLLSGGMSYGQLLPSFAMNIVMRVDDALKPFYDLLGMFVTVKMEKI